MIIDAVALSFPEIPPSLFTIPVPEMKILGFQLGPIPLRWYSLSYMIGLIIGLYYTNFLAARPRFYGGAQPVKKDDLEELFFWLILGMILGGRIGFVIFYVIVPTPDIFFDNPMMAFQIWDGGLSFHGGLVGVSLAMIGVALFRKISLFSLTDTISVTVPIVIALVRCANFINAELYGRPTDSSLGMVFPEGSAGANANGPPEAWDAVNKQWIYSGNEVPRHPSQLYEAALEGVLLAIIVSVMAWRFKALRKPGLITGVFLLGYGVARSFAENFRQPDVQLEFLLGTNWLTMGIVLSTPLWIGGVYLTYMGMRKPALTAPAK